jgi:hypothetical protein
MKKQNNTAASTQEQINVIAAALEQLQAIHPAASTKEEKEYQFTKEELESFVEMVLSKGAEAILDEVRTMDLEEDSDYIQLDLTDNRIIVSIDTDGIADELEEMTNDWDDTIKVSLDRWYHDATC